MKYWVFAVSALMAPFAAYVLSWDRRWLRFAAVAAVLSLCFYRQTSITFSAVPDYRGTALGFEVGFAHLAALAILGALALRGERIDWIPGRGAKLFLLYSALCLPSFTSAAEPLYAMFEVWKMALLYLFFLALYNCMRATDGAGPVLFALGIFAFVNFGFVAHQHFAGVWQPKGLFDHRNSSAFCMNVLGPLFFAGFLMKGGGTSWGRFCFAAFVCAAFSALRAYSRTALALTPLGYGVAWAMCMARGRPRNAAGRTVFLAALAAAALAVMLPRFIQRFETAGSGSANYRIESARCALEMIADEPLRGVGLNNWGLKINPPYPYARRAGVDRGHMERGSFYQDGIVETVYLLVAAECGVPCLLALVAWLLHYAALSFRLCRRLAGDPLFFVAAGLAGGLSVICIESSMEWILRMRQNLMLQVVFFALLDHLAARARREGGRT
ncbi:MAG: hypothetical protein IJ783_06520 [Kiritimatiellae bacterium]|nr:hypothetical protein [Kiritimatiellia bacterium]